MTMIPLYAQLLILFLIAVSSARVFFIRQTRLDSLVLFIPLSALLLFVEAVAWGYSINEIILTNLVFFAILVNYKSFFRFCNHLLIDTYSITFTIFSSVLLLLAITTAIIFIIFKPVYFDNTKLQIKSETKYLSGTFSTGFSKSEKLFSSKNLALTVFYPDQNQQNYQNDYAVLFIPDKRANFSAYEPFLKLLAKSGFKVYAGDFGFSTVPSKSKININFIKRYSLNMNSRKDGIKYFSSDSNNFYLDVYSKEYEVLSRIADKSEPVTKKLIIVADESPALCASRITDTARPVLMFHNIALLSEYKTPGFGFIQQADPLSAKVLFNLSKDKTGYSPSYVVMKIKSAINAYEKAQFTDLSEETK